jgi:serine/threonine-protein kinase
MSDTPPKPTTTLAYSARTKPTPAQAQSGIDDTVAAPTSATATAAAPLASQVRTTVLPRLSRASGTRAVVLDGKPRYEPLRKLGAGGQAEVTLAKDHDIDRTVAVKRLLPERRDDGSVLRFAEEVRTVGQLEHPNIVPIHDVGVDEAGQYFFVMKYVEGETLETVIEKLRANDPAYVAKYTPEYRVQIANEILRGVQHAHELGVLHRDLKPANVMVGSLGEVVVMDWGMAKRISDAAGDAEAPAVEAPAATERERLFQTQAGALVGTPAYMSPEQASGHVDKIDERSDVYSLAVMFYELFSLKHPRANCNTVAEMIASVSHEKIAIGKLMTDFLGAGAPAALAHFVRHGLGVDPKERYQTVADMRTRLDKVRDGTAGVECHVTFVQRILRGVSHAVDRYPMTLASLFILMMLATLFAVGFGVWKLVH